MGALVSCPFCNQTFNAAEDELEMHYLSFVHYSGDGPDHDLSIFLLDTLISDTQILGGPSGTRT